VKTYEAVLDFLTSQSIRTVFCLQSDGNMDLLAHAEEQRGDDFDIIQTRHEQAAVAMADGYARAGDGVPLVTVGRGPAIAQTGTALVTAARHGSDFLLLVPGTATNHHFDNKGFAQRQFLNMTLNTVQVLEDPSTTSAVLREALRSVRVGNGPAAIQVPRDVLNECHVDAASWPPEDGVFDPGDQVDETGLEPVDAKIREAVELYLDSDATTPPVLLAGRGALTVQAKQQIESLAERMNALVATTLRGRGFFDDHPFAVGFVGEYGNPRANTAVMDSNYVLAFGCSLNPYTSDDGHVFHGDTTLVHVDVDEAAIDRYEPVDLGVLGSSGPTAAAIERELADRGVDREGVFWTEKRRERLSSQSDFDDHDFPQTPGRIDPRVLLSELNELLPADRVVVPDTGHHTRWVLDGLETPRPEDFVWPSEFSSIGLGLPVGIGAAVATDRRTCVTVCGDAGFMMADHALETAVRNDIPVVIVIMNDEALGTEYHSLDTKGAYTGTSLVETPDLTAVASAMGATAHKVKDTEDLQSISATIGSRPSGPVVLECLVDRNVKHRTKM
jgi:thiamine pyrophosphate-dependent acetolactate synthase large subunit-like protein